MQNEERLSAQDAATAAILSQLRPERPLFDAREVAMEVVRRTAARKLWAWRGLAAALAAGLVISLLLRPQPRTVKQVVYVPAPKPLAHSIDPSPPPQRQPIPDLEPGDDYLAVRNRVLALGVQVLRPQAPVAARFPPMRALDLTPNSPSVRPESLLDSFNPFRRGERS